MSRTEQVLATHRWREPTSTLRLNWGSYRERYVFGLVLIVGGAIQLQGSNTYTLPLLLIGTAAHITGWSIMPARGWRRLVVVVPATTQIWLLLTGPQSMWTLTIPYLCWLLVRHRPAAAYLTVLFPIANGFIIPQFFSEYSGMPAALVISMAVFIGSTWLARLIAPLPSPSPLR
jgi:hypothetical protein